MSQVPKFTKIQELIYELPIERVMKKNVIKVSPDTSMTELKEVLRVNRISGVPVLEEGRLVGIISIEDLIKALVEGDIQAPVKKRMTTKTDHGSGKRIRRRGGQEVCPVQSGTTSWW